MDNKKVKKRATIRPLIITPIVFVLIFLVVAAPVFFKVFSVAQGKVHDAQKTLHLELSDLDVSDDYFTECQKDGAEMTRDGISLCYKLCTIECNNAAVGCDVYYGINRVSKRYGAGLSTKQGIFGEGKQIHIDGDASTAFKALKNVKKGDVFTVQTPNADYQYTVKEITTGTEYSKKVKGEYLLLTTQINSDAYAYQSKQKLMVVATLGEEVQ